LAWSGIAIELQRLPTGPGTTSPSTRAIDTLWILSKNFYISHPFVNPVTIDIGTANTVIYRAHTGMILNEPSVVAITLAIPFFTSYEQEIA